MAKTTKIIENPKTDRRVLIRINEILNTKNLDPSKLGRALGYSNQYGCQLMRGDRKLSINHLIKIADILEVNPASLLPGENPKMKLDFDEYIQQIVKDENKAILNSIKELKDIIKEIKKGEG